MRGIITSTAVPVYAVIVLVSGSNSKLSSANGSYGIFTNDDSSPTLCRVSYHGKSNTAAHSATCSSVASALILIHSGLIPSSDSPLIGIFVGIINSFSEVPANALAPIAVTPSPICRVVSPDSSKSLAGILPVITVASVRFSHPAKAPSGSNPTSHKMFTCVRPLHPAKAFSPISVTDAGIVISFNSVQSRKASAPMVVTESNRSTCSTILSANASFPI